MFNSEKMKNKFVTFKYGRFSGCLINAHLIKQGVRIRQKFFLDQADFDFFDKIRNKGFLTIAYLDEKNN